MSHHHIELSAWTIERVTESLVDAISQTPSTYRAIGRALARAVERFLDGAYLASYGAPDETAVLMNDCMRHLSEALHLCDSEHKTAYFDFNLAANALPEFLEPISGEA